MSNVILTKRCTKCGEEKGLEYYGKQKGGGMGVTSRCKQCLVIVRREARDTDEHREKERIYRANRFATNEDARQQNRDLCRANMRRRRFEQRENEEYEDFMARMEQEEQEWNNSNI